MRVLVRIGCGLACAWLLGGCTLISGKRVRSLEQMQASAITNLIVYRSDHNLELRYARRGKDIYAHATWPAATNGSSGYRQEMATLSLEKPTNPPRRALTRRANRVPIHNAQQWQQFVRQIWQGLVPETTNRGVLMLYQNQEVAVFRDAQRNLNAVRLEHKPRQVVLERTLNDADFSRRAIQVLETNLQALDPAQRQFFFVTGQEPPFVLFDLRQRLTVLLSYPADTEVGGTGLPALFVLRTLNSLVIKSLALSAIKNPFTVVSRGLWHIGNCGATVLGPTTGSFKDPPPQLRLLPPMDLAAWEKELDRLGFPRRYKGRLDLLIDGDQFFPALIQALQNAERSIQVLVYIFDTDDYAVKIANLLKERSAEVRVKVLIDEMGSLFAAQNSPPSAMPAGFSPPSSIKSYLRRGSHVHVRSAPNPWLTADHRKCILIDDHQAFLGGMNLGREYRYDWHDLMVRLSGPIVTRLSKDFKKAWAHAGWLGDFAYIWVSLFDRSTPPKREATDGIEIRPLQTQTGKLEIYHAQLWAIQRAQRYVYVENPYFDDRSILRELIQARRRGVDVRVILPAQNDLGIMKTCNLLTANTMIQNGIRVYAYPGMTHVKAAIYDGWACIGSANLNKMSLRVCQELNLGFSDPAAVNRLKRDLFEADFAKSRELKAPVPTSWLDSLIGAFGDQL